MKKEEAKTSRFAVASLVFGILSLLLGWIPFLGWILIILTLVLSSKSIKSINENKNLKGQGLAKTARVLGYVSLAIAVLATFYIFGIFGYNVSIGSASDMSAVPGQVLSMHYKGTDWSGKDYLRLYDDKGFNITVTPVPISGDNYFLFSVPPYFDMISGKFSSAKVNIEIIKESGKKSNTITGFEIKELPSASGKPGTATIIFLDGAIATAKETKKNALLEAETSKTKPDENLIAALDKSIAAYSALKSEVEAVMAGTKTKAKFAEINGKTFEYGITTLADTDKIYTALMQWLSEPLPISGRATAESGIYTDICSNLGGQTMETILHCVTKRMTFTDMMINTADFIGKTSSNMPLEKLAGIAGPIYFVTRTLPANTAAYEEDLEMRTVLTGKEEYEIAEPLRWYYMNKLGTSILDVFVPFFGTGIGVMGDLMLGNGGDAFKGIRLSEKTTRNLARQAMLDEGRLPSQSGLNLIKPGETKKEQPKTEPTKQEGKEETPREEGQTEEWTPETTPEEDETTGIELPLEFDIPKDVSWTPDYPTALVGEPYKFSFCDGNYDSKAVTKPSDICGENSHAVRWGNPPYHFQLETGSGFPPMGMVLHPNGLLDGTPTTSGESSFGVCAVDQSGAQKCGKTSLKVDKLKVTLDSLTCGLRWPEDPDSNGIDSIGSTIYKLVAKGTAIGARKDDELRYTDTILENQNFQHGEDKSIGYSDSIYEESSCGGWKTCTKTTDGEETISWTLAWQAVLHNGPQLIKASVWMKGMKTPVTREVTCG